MPLTDKGKTIMKSMKEQYGPDKGKSVFYASQNKGKIEGVEMSKGGLTKSTGKLKTGIKKCKGGK